MRYVELIESQVDPDKDHTLWISPKGKIWSLKDQKIRSIQTNAEQYLRDYDINRFEQPAVTHGTWMAYNWVKLFNEPFDESKDPYDDPIKLGWLRIRNLYLQFNINSTHVAAQKLFKFWWPIVAKKMKIEDWLTVYIDEISEDHMERNSLVFKLPEEKTKLINWSKGRN